MLIDLNLLWSSWWVLAVGTAAASGLLAHGVRSEPPVDDLGLRE